MNKPKFDPSQPFEAVKPTFDPSKPFDAVDAGPSTQAVSSTSDDPLQSKAASASAGAIQGATMGLGDELGAAGSTAMNAITGMSGPLAGGSLDDLIDDYRSSRDKLRAEFAKTQAANPKTFLAGQVAGGLASGSAAGTPSTLGSAMKTGSGIGAISALGNSDADLTKGQFGQAAVDTLKGAAVGVGAGAAGYGVGKAVSSLVNPSQYVNGLKDYAENKAVAATGATGKQIENFDSNAGRELLDRGIVGFGDDASNIAGKAEDALNVSRDKIVGSLNELDNRGGTVNRSDILNQIQAHIDELKVDPSQNEVVKRLESIKNAITEGPESVSLTAAEKTKRGFQDLSNYQDPVATRANKSAADVYRQSVEDSAEKLNPDLASDFNEGKDTFGLIAPIREAAQRRANTLAQSPIGGLGDISAAGAGFLKGGPIGAVVAPIVRRVAAPRVASSLAVGADQLADVLAKTPEVFGKYAPVLQAAAQRSGQSLAVAHYLLQQTDPEYREQSKHALGTE